jgi:hypothetical protein
VSLLLKLQRYGLPSFVNKMTNTFCKKEKKILVSFGRGVQTIKGCDLQNRPRFGYFASTVRTRKKPGVFLLHKAKRKKSLSRVVEKRGRQNSYLFVELNPVFKVKMELPSLAFIVQTGQ